MNPWTLTAAEARALPIAVQPTNALTIDGVARKLLLPIVDGRGDLIECWSESWLDARFVQPRHVYQSATDYGVVKAWHLHRAHTDQFIVTRGKIQILCIDLRTDSPTRLHANSIIAGISAPTLLSIPPGVAHGWKALSSPEAIVVNLQTLPYDAADEFRLPWDAFPTDLWEPLYR